MRFGQRRGHQADESANATGRWEEAAQHVTERFQAFNDLTLEEAVEAGLLKAPGNMGRAELTARIAASRGIDLSMV